MTSPGLTADGVELVSDALDAAALFADQNGDLAHDPRARLVADDARSVLLASRERWDVILVDLFLPWTAGAGALFSREFYELGLRAPRAGRPLLPVAAAAPARRRRPRGDRRHLHRGVPARAALGGLSPLAHPAGGAGRLRRAARRRTRRRCGERLARPGVPRHGGERRAGRCRATSACST